MTVMASAWRSSILSRVLSDYNSGKYAPGYYWHAIDAGVPLSGQPNRFAYFDPRFGLSYDLFGSGNTIVRGGWGAYRFVTQVNDVSAPLVTAQHVLGYNLPGQKNVMLSQLSQLAYKPCTVQCGSGSQTGFDPSDYGQPLTLRLQPHDRPAVEVEFRCSILPTSEAAPASFPTTARALKAATLPRSPIRTKPRSGPSSSPIQ